MVGSNIRFQIKPHARQNPSLLSPLGHCKAASRVGHWMQALAGMSKSSKKIEKSFELQTGHALYFFVWIYPLLTGHYFSLKFDVGRDYPTASEDRPPLISITAFGVNSVSWSNHLPLPPHKITVFIALFPTFLQRI
jgi:hypothetical protein